jgi:hypothetical protein
MVYSMLLEQILLKNVAESNISGPNVFGTNVAESNISGSNVVGTSVAQTNDLAPKVSAE